MNHTQREKLYQRCEALYPAPTESQVDRLTAWIVSTLDPVDWDSAANICMDYEFRGAYTDLRMRVGETGAQR